MTNNPFHTSSNTPDWAILILDELKELRQEIEKKKSLCSQWDYYDFVKAYRKKIQPNPDNYPEVIVDGRHIGVTFAGLLYDKDTGDLIAIIDAFEIYKKLYKKHKQEKLF